MSKNKRFKIKKNSISQFASSLNYAWSGLKYAFKHERNFRIEIMLTSLVIFLMLYFSLKSWEIIILFLMIVWVITVELINTVLERVVDILKPRFHPYAKLIKDIMAAVVLISALAALVVAIIIFLPHIKSLF